VFDVATMLWDGWYGVRVPVGAKNFSLPPTTSRPALGPNLSALQGVRGSFPGVKWPKHEVKPFPPFNHYSASGAEDKSKGIYTAISPISLHGLERETFPAAFLRTSLVIHNFTDLNSCSCYTGIHFHHFLFQHFFFRRNPANVKLFILFFFLNETYFIFIFIFLKSLDKNNSREIALPKHKQYMSFHLCLF
jgi:hypothetical protein